MQLTRMPARLCLGLTLLAAPLDTLRAQAIPPELGGLRYSRTLGDQTTFGRVTAAIALPGGLVAILDGMEKRVTLFGRNGALLGSRDERGRGPKEFFSPIALAARGESVVVLDRGNLRIVDLRMNAGALAWRAEIRVPVVSPSDICTVGERLFVLGFSRGNLVHELDRSGGIARSFGTAVSDDPTGGSLTAAGKLVCSPSGWIAVLASELNHVLVFSLEGAELWRGRIPGFRRQEFNTSSGVLRPLPPSDGYLNTIVSARASAENVLDIQLGRTPSNPGDVYLESRRLNVVTGSWLPITMSWPRLLTAADGYHLFYEESPFPLVKVYR